ncbi:11547_t:CDS:2 [Dentiscutata heterogama]|uniref:11547_t:CDS:1 n=1 Tax=Dentiscutata heterogama TaxID=1316150 RepID=A0ACA9KGE1_9GLOM|nr:11547_t:CDS:2 [Dentiscutata heterogama]
MSNVSGPERPKVDGGFERDSGEDILKQMNKVPLFMTELPEEENDALAALQSLIYEGPPEEVAENFKNQGNECFKIGKSQYQDAINFYTKALETNCQDNKIIEACLTNQNHRKVLTDCAKAIKLNPQNAKAFYRSPKALYALDKFDQALDCCEHGIEILDQKAKIKEERERKEREKKESLEEAIKMRNIKMETTPNTAIPISPHSVHLDTETQQLIWPVFFPISRI